MKAEVCVIRMIRKTIWNKDNLSNTQKTDTNDYFATDYFDIMRVEEKEMTSPLTSIMGIWPYKEMSTVDIAAHSYSLYRSEKMAESAKNQRKCGDPFENRSKEMPFLSIIQVHITPEILARRPQKELTGDFIDAIYLDLLTTVGKYVDSKEHQNETFVFSIYKMLSAGDFAVVVRSEEPETSFAISTLLRRRVTAEKEIVLYKTYTIFTFGDEVIEHEIAERSEADDSSTRSTEADRFVLRCSYSNLYWKNKDKVEKYIREEKLHFADKLYGLNGRYDFSVRVTKTQFFELFQDIKVYKQIGTRVAGNDSKTEKSRDIKSRTDDIVKYLRYLMDNHYLSYINERYLMAQDENSEALTIVGVSNVSNIGINKSETVFLDQKVAERYTLVKEKYEKVCELINPVAVGGKNLRYYMDLLGKQINLYYGINGYSDTRIYAAALLEQLDVILGSIDEYVGMYIWIEEEIEKAKKKEKKTKKEREKEKEREREQEEIRNLLEDYMRQSVCVLDQYAQHIRSRNLQSLQTPNYNLESGMSLEKMLIGYSEFIKVFMDFYSAREGESGPCEYFPVVVPALKDKDVSVENLFAKGKMDDWNEEKKIREKINAGRDRSCIIISVPTLMEIGDVRTMAASLIHEMAHQFRYETRKERNDALLQYLIHSMMREVINELIQNIQNETGIRDWNFYYGRKLEKALIEAYTEINYLNKDGNLEYNFQDVPYNNFAYCFGKDFYETFGYWGRKNEIRTVFQAFLRAFMQYYQMENSQCAKAVKILDELIEKMEEPKEAENKQSSSDPEKEVETIVKCAYALSFDCACQRTGKKDNCIWGNEGFETWIKDQKTEIEYRDKWNDAFEQYIKDNGSLQKELEEIYEIFSNFVYWVYDNCGNEEKVIPYSIAKKTEFLEKAYQKMCQEWKSETIQKELSKDYDGVLSVIGRTLGIDCNTKDNFKKFEEEITTVIVQKLTNLDKMANWRVRKYREETADMFMCNVMELTPFGYMYQLAVSWLKDRELPNEYYSRSQNLLLFQWCLEEQENKIELSQEKYRKLCVELAETLRKAINLTVKSLIAQGGAMELPDISIPFCWDNAENIMQQMELQDRLADLENYCRSAMSACKNECVKEEYTMLKLYGIMADMMEQLIGSAVEHLEYLETFHEIRDDYMKGIDKLKGLNEEMCDKHGKNGEMVNKLGRFCKEMGRWQNEPYKLLENDVEKEKMNACSIEFLLDMYYANKRRIAQQVGGEKCL